MADFDPPFASVGGVNRAPTTDEQSDGFGCGDADLTLFNRLFGRIEAELNAIQVEGGITPTEADDTTVLQAIQAMISAATGGGDVSNYVLFTQAQARLPIFPEVTTGSGVITVTAPSTGTVRVPAAATVLHRGIRTITTAETDLVTTASKTYHLRCAIAAGVLTFSLKDLADTGSYNPTTAAETNVAFDSTYDDMLVARVVTNSSNVATITNLTNKATLTRSEILTGTNIRSSGANNTLFDFESAFNWARMPTTHSFYVASRVNNQGTDADFNIRPIGEIADVVDPTINPALFNITRYKIAQTVMSDFDTTLRFHFSARA